MTNKHIQKLKAIVLLGNNTRNDFYIIIVRLPLTETGFMTIKAKHIIPILNVRRN